MTKFQKIYQSIFELPIGIDAKRMALEVAVQRDRDDNGYAFRSWPIVGITNDALDLYEAHSWPAMLKGIVRAHLYDRKKRGVHLFDRHTPIADAEAFFFASDQVVLATSAQNRFKATPPIDHALDPEEFPLFAFSVRLNHRRKLYLQEINRNRKTT